MVIIRIQSNIDWYKPNWVFRQFVDDAISEFPDDGEFKLVLNKAEAFGMLNIDTLEERTAAKTLQAIRKVAEETVEGRIPGWKRIKPEDKAGQVMYQKSIAELLELIRKYDATVRGPDANTAKNNG